MAFLVNGVFAFLIVDSAQKGQDIEHNNQTTTVIISFIATPFYFGNIYGAANSARRYNDRTRDDFQEEMRQRGYIPGMGIEVGF